MEYLPAWSITDWLAIITGLLYVFLAARGKTIAWLFGIVSCAIIAVEDFSRLKLYSDGVLQLIYIVLGVAGLISWNRDKGPFRVIRYTPWQHIQLFGISLLAAVVLGYFFRTWTDAAFPWLDAWTTAISLIATWLTIQKVLECWLYWIVADLIYIYLYTQRDAPAFAFLFGIYTILAIYGWFLWKKSQPMDELI
jgi:nicotinamide mononucleotide transporter